jgi:hypothetical protein
MLVNQAMEDILTEMVTVLLASKIKTDLQWSVFYGGVDFKKWSQ